MQVIKTFKTTRCSSCLHCAVTCLPLCVCSTKSNVLCHTLTTIPVTRHAMPMPTVSRSNSLNFICVPVSPNRIGSKIIQNISNAVATGFWKTFTVHIFRKETMKQSSKTHQSLFVPNHLTPKVYSYRKQFICMTHKFLRTNF